MSTAIELSVFANRFSKHSALLHTAYITHLQTTRGQCAHTHTHTHIHVYTFYRRSVEQLLLRIWGKLCISWACEQLLETFRRSKTCVCTERAARPSITHSHTLTWQTNARLYVKLQHVTAFDRGGAVGWGTALQTGRSRVRFPVSEFFIDIILPAALWSCGRLNL
jgi:hypothetical protein